MAIKEIKYSDVEQRAQTIKTYADQKFGAAQLYTDQKVAAAEAKIPAEKSSLPQSYVQKTLSLGMNNWTGSQEYAPSWGFLVQSRGRPAQLTAPEGSNPLEVESWRVVVSLEGSEQTKTVIVPFDFEEDGGTKQYSASTELSNEYGTTATVSITIYAYATMIKVGAGRSDGGGTAFHSVMPQGSGFAQVITDADVKVNSEVRFTLDEANGKIAGQFGLKKTIDKEAGKLTFTADTLPTSAITGTLEIGETSTEGAAFVDGIATSVNGGEASSGGTVTSVSVKMNGSVKGTVTTSGTIDLGTVVTDVSGKQDKITADNKLDVSLVNGLATVATSGSYNDLSDKPTIPSPVTETTVSNWGFTKNTGTVTSVAVKMNGADKGTVTGSGTIDLGTVLTSWDDVGSEAVISIIGKALYPVGAIYMSTANVNPSTFITGTTWVAWGSGRVPVGVDTSDTSFNTVEKTGGEKTHTLTESEMPAHKHTGTESTSLGNTKPQLGAPATVSKETIIADFTRTTEEVVIYESAATTPANNTLTVEHGITAGGGQPHSILQPYITCYMFKRTA